jgi:hypothetical protein
VHPELTCEDARCGLCVQAAQNHRVGNVHGASKEIVNPVQSNPASSSALIAALSFNCNPMRWRFRDVGLFVDGLAFIICLGPAAMAPAQAASSPCDAAVLN